MKYYTNNITNDSDIHAIISNNQGPTFLSYSIPHGSHANGSTWGVSVKVNDTDGIAKVFMYTLHPDDAVWLCQEMFYSSTDDKGYSQYDRGYLIRVPDNYEQITVLFRFEANDTLGNWGMTENIETTLQKGGYETGPTAPNDEYPIITTAIIGATAFVAITTLCYLTRKRGII